MVEKNENEPILDPERELPAPHDMLLTKGQDGQSTTPSTDNTTPINKGQKFWKTTFLKWLLFIIPPLLIIIFGVSIYSLTHQDSKPQPKAPLRTTSFTPVPTKSLLINNVYTNEELGFRLEVPSGWKAEENGQMVTFSPTNADTTYEGYTYPGYQLNISIEESDQSPQQYWAEFVKEGRRNPKSTSITIADVKGIRTENNSLDSYDITDFVSFNNKLYTIQQLYQLESDYEIIKQKFPNAEEEFNRILATFTFLDTDMSPSPSVVQKACTMEAKLCADGSSVGRTGPECEFAACPGE